MIKDDIDIFYSIEVLIKANKNIVLQVNSISDTKKITKDLK